MQILKPTPGLPMQKFLRVLGGSDEKALGAKGV